MYILIFQKQAFQFLKRINEPHYSRLRKGIAELSKNYFIAGKNTKRLKGEMGELFRLRIGHFRIIYSVDHVLKTITILLIKQRNSVY